MTRPSTTPIAAVMTVVLLLALPVSSGAESQSARTRPADGTAEAAAIQAMIDGWDVSWQEAYDRLGRQANNRLLRRRALQLFPTTYAGAWLNHEDGGKLVVAFSEHADTSLSTLALAYPEPELLEPADVEYSLAELNRFDVEEVRPVLTSALSDGVRIHSWGINQPDNLIEIRVHPSDMDETRNRIAATELPPNAIRLVAMQGSPEAGACSRTACEPPMRGGIHMKSDRGNNCTTGFSARNALAQDYVISAGHCTHGQTGWIWSHNGHEIGGVPYSKIGSIFQPSEVDALRIFVHNTSYWWLSRWVFNSNSQPSLQVRSRAFPEDWGTGDMVCRSGVTTGTRCGVVGNPFMSVADQESGGCTPVACLYINQLEVIACFRGGDSGGPVYDPNNGQAVAAGLAVVGPFVGESAGSCDPNWTANPLDRHYATHIRKAEEALNVTVVTGS